MVVRRTFRTWCILPVTIAALTACDSGTEPHLVGAVEIGPIHTQLQVGDERQLVATVLSESGSVIPGHPVSWTSSQQDVVSVNSVGLLRALYPGGSTITAMSGGKMASVNIAVRPGACTVMTTMSIEVGETLTGELDFTSCSLHHWDRAEGWRVNVREDRILDLELSSRDFRPHLVITDLEMNRVVSASPDADGVIRAVPRLPTGQYIVWAVSFDRAATGTYELSVRPAHLCGPESADGTIRPGDTLTGSVTQGACLFIHGAPAVGFRLDLEEAMGLRIDLRTPAAEALLVVTDLEMGVLWYDANRSGPFHARIERRIPAGEYMVWVTSIHRHAGAFALSMEEVEIELCPPVGSLPLGEPVSGTLSTGSCIVDGRRYADAWTLSLTDSATVQIDLTSHAFDAYLILEDEAGRPIAEDDDGGSGFNSRLIQSLPAGEYRVVVTTFRPRDTGPYQLSAQPAGSPGAAGVMLGPAALESFGSKLRRR